MLQNATSIVQNLDTLSKKKNQDLTTVNDSANLGSVTAFLAAQLQSGDYEGAETVLATVALSMAADTLDGGDYKANGAALKFMERALSHMKAAKKKQKVPASDSPEPDFSEFVDE